MTIVEPVPIAVARANRARAASRTSATARARDLFARMALALNVRSDLRTVLGELAALTLTAIGADRCSVLVLDGERFLTPVAAAGGLPGDAATLRSLPRLDVREAPGLGALLAEGRVMDVPDVPTCPFVPHSWADAFSLRSAMVAPMRSVDGLCGVVAVDFRHAHAGTDDEAAILEVVATYAALAVRHARLVETDARRARVQNSLTHVAGLVSAAPDRPTIARALAGGYAAMLGVDAGAVALFDARRRGLSVVTVDGTESRLAMGEVPEALRVMLEDAWHEDARPLSAPRDPWLAHVVNDARRDAYVLLPVGGTRLMWGLVVLAVADGRVLTAEEYAGAEALAAVAAAALERLTLQHRLERRIRQLKVLHELTASLAERAGAPALIRRLNALLADDGVEVTSLHVRDRRLAKHLGVTRSACHDAGELVTVPLKVGRRVVGELTVRPPRGEEPDRAYLEAVARGVAEVATRGAAAAELEDAARHRAVAAERDRIAADLHDSVGQLLVAIGLLARRNADELPAGSPWGERFARLAEISREGKWAVDDAVRALAFVPAGRRGLVDALRALARSVAADSGLTVTVVGEGRQRRRSVEGDQALYRVAHEALANAWRHARCASVVITVTFEDGVTRLEVRDDGIGLGQREPGEGRHGFGMTSMRRAIVAVGGTVRVTNRPARGVVVEASVPVGR
jgi:signal transduction histidine kinase